MNSQEINNDEDIHSTWRFIFNDVDHPNLPQYPKGYYINLQTKETYAFSTGIKHIVGLENERRVYDMWWIENG